MNTRSITAEYRLSRWAWLVQECAEGAYCAGMLRGNRDLWKHVLLLATQTACGSQRAGNRYVDWERPDPRAWTALSIREKSATADGLIVEVGDCRVHAHAGTDTGFLTRVCQALKTLWFTSAKSPATLRMERPTCVNPSTAWLLR